MPTPPDSIETDALDYDALERLAYSVVEAVEPLASLPSLSAHEARLRWWGPDPKQWVWYDVSGVHSPLGFWYAELGNAHGPDDHAPIRWRPSTERDVLEDAGAAWAAVQEMRQRGVIFEVESREDWTSVRLWLPKRRPEGRVVGDEDDAVAFCRAVVAAGELLATATTGGNGG